MSITADSAADVAPPGDLEFKTAAVLDRPSSGVGSDANTTVDPETHEVTAVVAVTGVRDDVGDIIVPGAFERSLRERPRPKVCLGHDWNRPIGKTLSIAEYRPGDPNLPETTYDGKPWPKQAGALIAKYTPDLSTEDGRNAFGSAKFFGRDESTFSIGYKTRTAKHSDDTRHLHDVDLYEYGPVLVPANRLATLQDIKADANGIEHTAIEPAEEKTKQVRDVAYWGEPYGTPITGNMHPHGPKARAERREGRTPSRSVGIMAPGEAAPEAPKITPTQRRADAPAALLPEPASTSRVLPHSTRAKGNDATHINNLAEQVSEGGSAPEADDEQRAAVDKAMHGLLDEAITPTEVGDRLRQHPALNPAQRQGEEGGENPHEDDIAHAVADYTARYQALASRQHENNVPVPGAEHYAQMSNGQVSAAGDAASNIAKGMRDNGISTDHPAYQQAVAQTTGAYAELQRRNDEIAAHPSVMQAHQEGLAYREKNPALAEQRAKEFEPELQKLIAANQENEPKRGSATERLPYQVQATMHGLRGQNMQGNNLPETPKTPTSAGEAARTGVPTGNSDRDASALTIMNKERGRAMVANMSDEALAGVDKELAGRASALGKPGQLSTAHQTIKNEITRRAAAKAPKVPGVAEKLNGRTLPYTVVSGGGRNRAATVEFQGNHYGVEHHGGVLGHVVVTDPLGAQTKVSGGSTLELPSSRSSSRERAVREALSKAHDSYLERLATDKGASEQDLAKRHADTMASLTPGEQESRASHFSDGLLGALDTEMGSRATALGKPGQVSSSHQVVKDEIAARAQRANATEAAKKAEETGRAVTPDGAHRDAGEARRAATAGDTLTGTGGVTISPSELDEAAKAGDETHGLHENPDGSLEVEKSVADRQDRVESLLNDHASGKLDLTGKTVDDLHTHRNDLTAELSLQHQIAKHDALNPPKVTAPAKPKVAAEGPKVRPGLAGAAKDHAEALRSGDAETIARTRARLDSSLRRSRAGSDSARTLADHISGGSVDAGRLDDLAGALKNESRVKRNAAERSRRTAKRLDRERIRSVLGSVDTELRSRGEAPTLRDEPGAPNSRYTDKIAVRAGKDVPRAMGTKLKVGDVVPMKPSEGPEYPSNGNREWQQIARITSPKENGTAVYLGHNAAGTHHVAYSANEFVQLHSDKEQRASTEAAKAANEIRVGSQITGHHPFYGDYEGEVTKVHKNGGVVAKLTKARRLPAGHTSGNLAIRKAGITSVRNPSEERAASRITPGVIKKPSAKIPGEMTDDELMNEHDRITGGSNKRENARAKTLRTEADKRGFDIATGDATARRTAEPAPVKPLTDDEYAKHTKMVEDTLNREIKAGRTTDREHTVRREGKIYGGNRARMHSDIVNELWAKHGANVPTEGKAVIAGGLGGAGKSTVLKGHAGIEGSHYLTINPDDIKEEFVKRGMVPEVKGLSPMEASPLVHEESSHVANLLAKRAYENKTNVMWDITMSSKPSVEKRLNEMAKHGYSKPDAVFVDIPVETSVSRALSRHRRGMERFRNGEGNGGRYVPPSLIRKNSSSTSSSANREVFDSLKGRFGSHVVYDNSVVGREPQKITGNGRWGVGDTGLENFHASDTAEQRASKLAEHYRFLDTNGTSGPYRNDRPVRESLRSIDAPETIGGDKEATPERKAQVAQMLPKARGDSIGTPPRLAIQNLSGSVGSNEIAKKLGTAAEYSPLHHEVRTSGSTLGKGHFHQNGFFTDSGDETFAQRSLTHEYGHAMAFDMEKTSPGAHSRMLSEAIDAIAAGNGKEGVRAPAGEIRGDHTRTVAESEAWLAKNKSKVINRVGTYAGENRHELLAELYQEARHSASPSPAAKIVGEYTSGRKS